MNKKTRPTTCYLQEIHFRLKDTHKLKMKRWKKIFHGNGNQKRSMLATLTLDKQDMSLIHCNIIYKGEYRNNLCVQTNR